MIRRASVSSYFHHTTPGISPKIETDQNEGWGRHALDRAQARMRYFDGFLRKHPYLAGENFSMADITAFAGLAFADFAGIDVPDEPTHLTAWRARVGARPSVAHA